MLVWALPNIPWAAAGSRPPLCEACSSDHPQGTEMFPGAQPDSPWQLYAIPVMPSVSRSRAWHHHCLPSSGSSNYYCYSIPEEKGASVCSAGSTEVASWPPLLQSGQPKCPQPLFTGCACYSSVPSSGWFQRLWHPLYMVEPRTAHIIDSKAALTLNTMGYFKYLESFLHLMAFY